MSERLMTCSTHHTATVIKIGVNGYRSAPPVELVCPLCINSRRNPEQRTGTSTPDTAVGRDVQVVIDTPSAAKAREDELFARWQEKQLASGKTVPGSYDEYEALARMDSARAEAVHLDHLPLNERGTKKSRQAKAMSYHVPTHGWRG